MCGRFTSTNPARLRAAFPRFRFGRAEDAPARYNVAPSQPVLAVRNDGANAVEAMTWGPKLINARAETLAERPAFRDALRRRRCAIFADGFYEWQAKRPVRFTLAGERPFAFAGLWEPEASGIATCTIVTCEANALVRRVHGRMPVILADEDVMPWLSPGDLAADAASAMLGPYDAASMRAQDASMRLNDPRVDAPDVLNATEPVQLGFQIE